MKTGRKSFGEELKIVERYSNLSELYFKRIKERLESEDKKEQDFALQLLNGAFTKMIPQTLDGQFKNTNLNADIECSPEEHEAVKQALIKAVENTGSQE